VVTGCGATVTSATDEEVQRLRKGSTRQQASRTIGGSSLKRSPAARRSTVNIRVLAAEIVLMFEVFERHGRTEVETRYSPQYRRPAPGTPQEVVDATMEQFELAATVTRTGGHSRSGNLPARMTTA
jgi:hypothetical protein